MHFCKIDRNTINSKGTLHDIYICDQLIHIVFIFPEDDRVPETRTLPPHS